MAPAQHPNQNNHEHFVPLPPAAVELLKKVRCVGGQDLIFAGPEETAVSGFGKVKVEARQQTGGGTRRDTVRRRAVGFA